MMLWASISLDNQKFAIACCYSNCLLSFDSFRTVADTRLSWTSLMQIVPFNLCSPHLACSEDMIQNIYAFLLYHKNLTSDKIIQHI